MKKILSSISVIAAVAAVFTACTRQEISTSSNEGNTKTVKLTSAFTETKAVFGDKSGTSYPAVWTGNESSVYVSLNLAEPKEATSISYNDAKTYMNVSATVTDDESGSYTFYAIAPGSAYKYYKNNKLEIEIPDTQKPSTSSVDESAMVLFGWNETALTEFPGEDDDPVVLKFHHVPAYLNLTIDGLDELVGGETVQSISFSSATRLGGQYYYVPGTSSDYSDYGSYTKYKDYSTITVTPADESGKNIWVAVLPILKGTEINITIKGDESEWMYIYTLSADLKAGSVGELTLKSSVFSSKTTQTYTPDYENALTSDNGDFAIEDATNDDNITIWSFDGTYGAKATAYISDTRYAVDSYLISPIIDLSDVNNATLAFSWAGKFFSTPISDYAKVLVRVVNEDGTYGDWVELTPNNYFTNSDWNYVNVSIDLADYVGKKIQIGFEYISTTSSAGTLEIKNFSVTSSSSEEDENGYTLTFSSTTNGSSISSYTDTWTATCNNFTWTLVNFNNNKNGWEYVKCGRKNNASVATITTSSAIPISISTVTVTIDNILSTDVINSTTLYVASDADFSKDLQTIAFTAAKGDNVINVTTPAENMYYKLEFDCASHSKNGIITISKVVYSK